MDDGRHGEGDQRGEKKKKKEEEGLKRKHEERLRRTSVYFGREFLKRSWRVSGSFSTKEGSEGKEELEENFKRELEDDFESE